MRAFPLSAGHLKAICQQLQEAYCGATVERIAKLHSGYYALMLGKKASHSWIVIACYPYGCLYPAQDIGHAVADTMAKALETKLLGFTLQGIEQVGADRIAALHFSKEHTHCRLIAPLFSRHLRLYLIDAQGLTETTNDPKQNLQELYSPPPRPTPLQSESPCPAPTSTPISLNALCRDIEEHARQLAEEKRWQKAEKLLDQLSRRLAKRLRDAEKTVEIAEMWPEKQHEGDLIKANLHRIPHGATRVQVDDWLSGNHRILLLDKRYSPIEQAKRLYKRSQKERAALAPMQQRIAKLQEQYHKLTECQKGLQEKKLQALEAIEALQNPPKAKKESTKNPFRSFCSCDGTKIWVGKEGRANDLLTFQFARGEDFWLHVANYPGAHVIARPENKGELHGEGLSDALQLAVHFSRAHSRDAEVHITQRKWVRRLSGAKPGQVSVAKVRAIAVKPDAARLKKLLESQASQ